jgi:UDP-3-O-[3-hydroxymyristoyl] glucosamine N-acyltransferase
MHRLIDIQSILNELEKEQPPERKAKTVWLDKAELADFNKACKIVRQKPNVVLEKLIQHFNNVVLSRKKR